MGDPALGPSLSVHRGTIGAGGWLWYVGAVLVASGVMALVKGQLAGAALGTGIGALLLALPVYRWRQQLEVFENGFVWSRIGGRTLVTRAEVSGTELLAHRSRTGQHVELVVHLAGGRALSIAGLEGAEQARAFIDRRPAAAPPAGAAPGWEPPAAGWRPPGGA